MASVSVPACNTLCARLIFAAFKRKCLCDRVLAVGISSSSTSKYSTYVYTFPIFVNIPSAGNRRKARSENASIVQAASFDHCGAGECLVGIQEVNGSNPLASTTLSRFCAESRCSPERSDGFEAGRIRWPHRIEVGFGQIRLSFLRVSLVI